ncbi:E3 ubiquitin-protein ligase CHFR isoform X1 [Sphaeramia orbicularis]|uniref:E3 ubiquitin-protein ligase CHFR n=1 Tax=Sphaeramia orbicularis TaxID=375764 RepID=A0A672YQK1_9TELE|nr:E3 ubiquitin-protein ligase CHFR isoform X1 [Sphaeramia orbicularis]XP_029998870.1 E3 ubiquitin-protein ligase CHFR isoform X1 [Sphaeramia orbicularis]XP_029998871.1 E3 ubiquitin-protein ligase CHFR isoform X1 [Sphaeramia orbicularis]
MDSHRAGRPWGKLVKVDSNESEVLLFNRECTIGRKKGCDLSFPANKLVSGEHCKIVQDESSGLVWLEDMSTNGTVINMSKLVKKQTHMLQNGDVIYFVYRKSEPEQNIAYVFHSINSEQVDSRSSYDISAHIPVPIPPSDMVLSVEPVMLTAAPRDLTQEEPQPSTSTSHFCVRNPTTSMPTGATEFHASGQAKDAKVPQENKVENLEPESKRRKTEDDKDYDLGLPHTSHAEVAVPTKGNLGSVLPKPPADRTKTDKMEESLTCIICQDLLHDCVSLQPCMHTFCAACYSGWMERSSLCPTCRCPVERIRKNHILNNLVEAYLIQHPEKCRSEEDLKSMDSRNKITQDMLQPKVERSFSDEEGSSDYLFELSDNDSDSSDISQPLVMCRQCPGYKRDVSQMLFPTGSNYWVPGLPVPLPSPLPPRPAAEEGSAKPSGEQPSTSADIPSAAQEYCCPPQGCHLICTCCLQPMPDRRTELNSQGTIAQQCVLCQRPFCHMYWGCQRIGCQGCLARFSDLNLTDKCLDGVLNNNNYESEILQNYLSIRGKSWKDLLQESLQGIEQGHYYLTDCRISANTILCFCCGLRAFKELAYKYRQNITPSELPAAVTSRPDCYWGCNCRTQVKAHHAMKFNHICEQTRFKS